MSENRLYKILRIQPAASRKAVYTRDTVDTGQHKFAVKEYLARGNNGIVFGTKNYVIKIEQTDEPNFREVDIAQYASYNGIGPVIWTRGKLDIDLLDLKNLAKRVESQGFFHPWSDYELQTPGLNFWYSVTERWDMSLGTYLEQRSKTGGASYRLEFFKMSPRVIQKIINLVDKLHKARLVHLDLHFDNILVNLKDGLIVDVALTDFGSSMHIAQYFYKYSGEVRDRRITVLAESPLLRQLAEKLAYGPGVRRDQTGIYYWLQNDPRNIDLALFHAYALEHPEVTFENLPKLWYPENFRFELGWKLGDFIPNVPVYIDGVDSGVRVTVYGKMKAYQLRKNIANKLPEIETKVFVTRVYRDRMLLPRDLEAERYSRLIPFKQNDQVIIELKDA